MSSVVLVVDDSAMIRMQVGRTLIEEGYEVAEAVDGQDAWTQLSEGLRPSVIVCDVNMPNMNGLELLEQIGSEPALSELSVIMLTTEGQPELIRQARRLGAKGWLVKPFRARMLLDVVNRLEELAARCG